MSDSLKSFLLSLVDDPEKLARFREAPAEVVAEADLSDEEEEILCSNDPHRIREYLGEADGFQWIVFCWIFSSVED